VLLLKIDWGGVLHLGVTLLPLVAGDFDATNQAHGKCKANDLPRKKEQEEKLAKSKGDNTRRITGERKRDQGAQEKEHTGRLSLQMCLDET
jgi:hypothetical protein